MKVPMIEKEKRLRVVKKKVDFRMEIPRTEKEKKVTGRQKKAKISE